MHSQELFYRLSKHKRILKKHKNLFKLFFAAFDVTDSLSQVSPLQKDFIITEVGYSYQHFGFSLFSDTAINLAKIGIEQQCGVEAAFIEKYMLHLRDFLHDEIELDEKSKYFSLEVLEKNFAHEFIKRIFCTEDEEDVLTGMFIFENKYTKSIRQISRKKISQFSQNEENNSLSIDDGFISYNENIINEFNSFMLKFKNDPLNLIVSRFESFVNFFEGSSNSLFVFKENNENIYQNSKKITAILSLLVPHSTSSGQFLLKDTLLTSNKIAKILSFQFKSEYFNLNHIKAWFGVDDFKNMKIQIEHLLEEAIKCGIVFKIPSGSQGFSFGLSESGLKIIQPFHALLTDSLISENAC